MKKIITLLSLVLLTALMLTSCETVVSVSTLVPAKINLSSYSKVGVASTESYVEEDLDLYFVRKLNCNYSDEYIDDFVYRFGTSYRNLSPSLAVYATAIMNSAVSDGNPNFANNVVTDALISSGRRTGNTVKSKLQVNGIDAVITSRVTRQDLDEYLEVRPYYMEGPDKKQIFSYKLYLIRKAFLSLSYTVTDVNGNFILYSGELGDNEKSELYLGYREGDNSFVPGRDFFRNTDGYDLFTSILDKIGAKLRANFSQSTTNSFFSFQKSDNAEVTKGIELASAGYKEMALDAFLTAWERDYSFEGGYNAAIMYFTLGEYDKAQELAFKVWTTGFDSKAKRLYEKITGLASDDVKAKQQLGIKETVAKETELIGF